MEFCKIWVEQCEAARRIEAEFGTDKALDYLKRKDTDRYADLIRRLGIRK